MIGSPSRRTSSTSSSSSGCTSAWFRTRPNASGPGEAFSTLFDASSTTPADSSDVEHLVDAVGHVGVDDLAALRRGARPCAARHRSGAEREPKASAASTSHMESMATRLASRSGRLRSVAPRCDGTLANVQLQGTAVNLPRGGCPGPDGPVRPRALCARTERKDRTCARCSSRSCARCRTGSSRSRPGRRVDRQGDEGVQRVQREPRRGGDRRRRPHRRSRPSSSTSSPSHPRPPAAGRPRPAHRGGRAAHQRLARAHGRHADAHRPARPLPLPRQGRAEVAARDVPEMGRLDVEIAQKLTELLRTEDVEASPRTIRNEDDKVDALHLSVFDKVLGETLEGRGGRHGRRHPREPLPRALRRPRGVDRQEGAVPRDRRLGSRDSSSAA